MIDHFFRLHRRPAAKGYRAYRASLLARPPDTHPAPVCLLSVAPPFLVELCHRKHKKLVLEVSFNLSIYNDLDAQTLSPLMPYETGMDEVLKRRAKNHLKKMRGRGESMSESFSALAAGWDGSMSGSDGEWDPPPAATSLLRDVLSLPPRNARASGSAEPPDLEEEAMLAAAADTQRPRAGGTRWDGRMRSG